LKDGLGMESVVEASWDRERESALADIIYRMWRISPLCGSNSIYRSRALREIGER